MLSTRLVLVVDGGLAAVSLALAWGTHQVTMVSRLRWDAALDDLRHIGVAWTVPAAAAARGTLAEPVNIINGMALASLFMLAPAAR